MNKAQAQQHRRPVATVQVIRNQSRPASRVNAATAAGTALQPVPVSLGNSSGGSVIIK